MEEIFAMDDAALSRGNKKVVILNMKPGNSYSETCL